MTMVFKTQEGSSEDVEIAGVGVLFADAKGGVPVATAALAMSELQETDENGALVVKDGAPVPLTGSKLTAAARKWADAHDVQVVNLTDEQVAGLPQEAGLLPDSPPAAEVAAQIADYLYADGESPMAEAEGPPPPATEGTTQPTGSTGALAAQAAATTTTKES